jgi:arylsulfatase A-like enzyme
MSVIKKRERAVREAAMTVLLIVLILTACTSKTPTVSPPSATPCGTETPTARRYCGDGTCDGPENVENCPQDCAAPTTSATITPRDQTTEQPNIVFILTDDLDYAALEFMPNLNALIGDQGTTFSNFLISMPLCCPSRATILRGQYGHNTQIMGNDLPYGGFPMFQQLGEEESTIATWLEDSGYRTMLAGKYLNAFPDQSDLMHIPPGWTEWYSPMEGEAYTQYDYTLNENGQQVAYGDQPDDYGTDVYADKTIQFIHRSVDEGQPFFAFVSVYAPHWPTTPAPRHARLFADAQAPRTPNFNESDVSDKPSYIRNLPLLTDEDITRVDEEWRLRLRSMQAVDDLVGDVVDTLESTGQLDNTYIFFTSDNGYHLGNHRQFLGKTAPYEEEIRVMMVVRGPGVPAGQTLDHLIGNTDLASTWAEIAGVEPPDFVDGRSILPLMRDNPPTLDQWRQSFLLEHAPYELTQRSPSLAAAAAQVVANTPPGLLEPPDPEDQYSSGTQAALMSDSEALPYRGIRTTRYVYVEYPTGEKELYDLEDDPYQLENVVVTAEPALVDELAARLNELATCAGESCRAVEDRSFVVAAPAPAGSSQSGDPAEPLIYYLGYATQDNMEWVEAFDVDVLTRGFLLFLNSNEAWLSEYGPRMEVCQEDGRQFLVAIQAAVLVENAEQIPGLGSDDPALAFPMDPIPQWETFACRTPNGSTLGEAFAHSCLNNPAFRAFFEDRLRALIDSGADGVHIDELQTRYFTQWEGFCDACIEGFRDYLALQYSSADLNTRYDIADISQFDYRQRLAEEGNLNTPTESPLHNEWWLYQLSSLAEAEEELVSFCKSYAEAGGREFVVNTNAYEPEQNPDRALEMALTDFSAIGTGMTIRLRRAGRFVTELRTPPSYSYLPLYRMAQGLTPDKPVTLFIDGPGGTDTMQALSLQEQRDIVRWLFAEAYAAGARFHVPYPSLDYYAPLEECQRYVGFIHDNQAVYDEAEHLADLGILFSYASEIWDYWAEADDGDVIHNRQYYGLAQAFTDMSIQYDAVFAPDGYVIQDTLTLEDLLQYETIIVPWAYSLNDHHVQLLEEYVRRGNELVIIGDLATLDERSNPRPDDVMASLVRVGATSLPNLDLEAYLADPRSPEATTVLMQLASLVPDGLVTISNPSVTALLNRGGDTIYCHLINKERSDEGFRVQEGIRVTIALPVDIDRSAAQALYISPDLDGGEPTLLPVTYQDGTARVTVPELEVYGVVVFPATD